jgi:hypothetical protein
MRIIQCAAATQGTHPVLISSDSDIEMAASHPFWTKSYIDFITDVDLLQAKADVEECYRRRARRAGLEGALAVGRPMTEEEINDLSEQQGDWGPANEFGSRGKKRSREVVELSCI